MKNARQLIVTSGLIVLALAACTKKLPYKETLKEDVQEKAAIDTKAEYIYSSSMLNASRSSKEALPFSSSDTKRVKFEWTKDSLRIMEVERDARFQANSTNNKLVLEIPVDHIDYQCAKDKYGECTDSEEENKDVTWDHKGKFKFKVEAAKSGALELLPIVVDKLRKDNCYEEVGSRLLDVKLESTALNIQIERTFKINNMKCLAENRTMENLSDATVSAVYHYSMVKADSIISKDYQPVSYPTDDQNTFGFFTTERIQLDSDNNSSVNSKIVLMNRWNPNRSEINYYLSDEFAKPENSKIRELTYKTVDALNDGLGKAGAKFHINLKDGQGQSPGDIRNSMIVLVEDPVASSVIGYGPQTQDPVTGEIISARTIMFLGTIKKNVKYTYDEILREKRRKVTPPTPQPQGAGKGNDGDNGGLTIENGKAVVSTAKNKVINKQIAEILNKAKTSIAKSATHKRSPVVKNSNSIHSVQDIVKDVKSYTKRSNNLYAGGIEAQMRYLQEVKNCAYGLNAEGYVGTGISADLANKFAADAKPWDQLSETEKQQAIDIILPEIWIPTLIHEMGHNLGLRHNFQGSEDKANFYSADELKQMGINHPIPFSTVMEYGDDLKALPVLGKYDIAALRFGYTRQVETKDGKIMTLASTVSSLKKDAKSGDNGLKDYGYCTDEHTGINAGCRRFDLGTSYVEIVQNEIQNYLESYKLRNFRNGRSNMSLVDDPLYAAGVYSRFKGLRLMQEVYERIKYRYELTDDAPEWAADPFLKDLRDASQLAARFLIDVLKTPDQTCIISQANDPKKIVGVMPLDHLDPGLISCFDGQVKDGYMVVGQFGKSFKARKDSKATHPYSAYADQIDVRGYWLDKLMAARVLFARTLGVSNLDEKTDNFMDRTDLQKELSAAVYQILLNTAATDVEIEGRDGSVDVTKVPVDTSATHIVEKPIYEDIAKQLSIPFQSVSFAQILASEAARYMVDGDHKADGREFADSISVVRARAVDNLNEKQDILVLQVGTDRLIATPDNVVAYMALRNSIDIQRLDKIDPKRLNQILKAKMANQTLPDLKEEEKAVWSLDKDLISAYMSGGLGSVGFYQNLLTALPTDQSLSVQSATKASDDD